MKTPLLSNTPGAGGLPDEMPRRDFLKTATVAAAGLTCARIVELLDIYPMLADLAGLTQPGNLQGRSRAPLLKNHSAQWPYPAFTQVQRGRFGGYSIRTERCCYPEWDLGAKGVEPYDEDADPQELKYLAHGPKYAEVCARMKAQLKACHPVVVRRGKRSWTRGRSFPIEPPSLRQMQHINHHEAGHM